MHHTAEDLASFVEYAPRNPPRAPSLVGFTSETLTVCGLCAARLSARGFGTALAGFTPVWATPSALTPNAPTTIGPCDVCRVRSAEIHG